MKILIVEPHGDDALFSMFDICKLYKSGIIDQLDIVTVSGRSSESFKNGGYASSSVYLNLKDIEFKDRPTKHTVVNKLFKEGVNLDSYFNELIMQSNNEDFNNLMNELKVINFDDYDYVVTNVGVAHLNHIITRLVLLNLVDCNKLILSNDIPYSCKVYGKKLLDSTVSNLNRLSLLMESSGCSNDNFINEKIRCLKDYYPTETLFLRWDRDNLEKPCIYWHGKDNELIRLIKEMSL